MITQLKPGPKIINDKIVSDFSAALYIMQQYEPAGKIASEVEVPREVKALNKKIILELLNEGLSSIDIIEQLSK